MRTFDFTPLYRSTVGFDRILSMFDQPGGVDSSVPRSALVRPTQDALWYVSKPDLALLY